jgi:DNA-binding CsgD family transcriptional regulator
MKLWFENSFFDDETVYIKSLKQQQVCAFTLSAQNELSLRIYQNLQVSDIFSDLNEIYNLEQKLVNCQKFVTMEAYGNPLQAGFWEKRPISIDNQIYFVIEKIMYGAFSFKQMLNQHNFSNKMLSFSKKQEELLFLVGNGFSYAEIGKILNISVDTVKSNVYRRIITKINETEEIIKNKDDLANYACFCNLDKNIPSSIILKKFRKPILINVNL